MNTSKQTKPKVKLLTKRKYTVSSKATRKTNQKPLIAVTNSTIASNFMNEAKAAINKVTTSIIKKLTFLNRASLRNIKWLKVRETLHFLPGSPGVQRTLKARHINTLTDSISKYGLLRSVITVEVDFLEGIKRLYIIDGQHGFMAAMRLGIPVSYVVVPNINNHDDLTNLVATFNSSARSWTQGDYINSWAQSKKDYKQLLFLKNKYGFDFDTIMIAATGVDGSTYVNRMKAGKFIMLDFKKTELACQRVSTLLAIVPKIDRWSIKAIIRAATIIFTEEGYTNAKHKSLLIYVKANEDQLLFCASKKSIALEFLRKGL